MDNRKAKRPRSSTPTKGDSPPKKKNKNVKKNKKSKPNLSTNVEPTATVIKPPKNSLEETATADGRIMSQMLSTFSKLEQSRFEAFKRSSFDQAAVQNWIAACLVRRSPGSNYYQHQLVRPAFKTAQTPSQAIAANAPERLIDETTSVPAKPRQKAILPPLSDLVVPGSHGDVSLIVSIAAKVYAQRLVTAAVALQQKEAPDESFQDICAGKGWSSSSSGALRPDYVLKAVQERKSNGVDPGFFMQANDALQWSQVFDQTRYDQRRLAAVASQEAYDEQFGNDNGS